MILEPPLAFSGGSIWSEIDVITYISSQITGIVRSFLIEIMSFRVFDVTEKLLSTKIYIKVTLSLQNKLSNAKYGHYDTPLPLWLNSTDITGVPR